MYLEHFKLKEFPFTLTPNTDFYCGLPGHQAVLNVLQVSLKGGEGFIKVVGEVGAGKTILCRKLLNTLGEDFVTAYIPFPNLTEDGLYKALARELHVKFTKTMDKHTLIEGITKRLLDLNAKHKHVVVIIDEAQALSEEALEAVRLLTNLETEAKKLLHVVLFGQPELDERLNRRSLRQLKQRITFSCYVEPITRTDLDDYIYHRLGMAGYSFGQLFTRRARAVLYAKSKGIPRLINVLAHKSLMIAYGRGEMKVTHKAVTLAAKDTDNVTRAASKVSLLQRKSTWWAAFTASFFAGSAFVAGEHMHVLAHYARALYHFV